MSENTNNNELNLEVVKGFIEQNKDNEEVKGLLGSYVEPKEQELNLDVVKRFLNENKDGQSFFDKAKSSHLDSWKNNNFEKIFNEEAIKRGYELDETTKKMRELEAKIEEREKQLQLTQLKVVAKDIAKEKGIPFEFVDFAVTEDEEQTKANLEKFEQVFTEAVQKAVEEKLSSGARTPVKTNKDNPEGMTIEQFKKMGYSERVKLKQENPELYQKLLKG